MYHLKTFFKKHNFIRLGKKLKEWDDRPVRRFDSAISASNQLASPQTPWESVPRTATVALRGKGDGFHQEVSLCMQLCMWGNC